MMSYDCPHPVSRTYQYKKITKPLLERKRRARINRCLEELKDLMMQALETEGENISKLEKADILELTVRHLQRLQASRPSGLSTSSVTNDDVSAESRWQSGFGHCAAEACRFLSALPGEAAERLAKHLASGLNVPNLKNAMKISSEDTTNVISNLDRTAKVVSPILIATPPVNNAAEARLLSKSYSVSRLNVCSSPQTELKKNILRPDQKPFLECSVTTMQFSHVSKHANGATGADEEEEIDVERIDERENSDPMWRPW